MLPSKVPSSGLDAPISLDDGPKKPLKVSKGPGRISRFITGWKKRWQGWSRNTRFAVIAGALLLFGAAALGFYYFTMPNSDPSIQITKKAKAAVPKTVASPLSGLPVDPGLAARPVTGIMIENSTDARPQSGLEQAGVVFEAIAEGGITRFLALFQDTTPQYIGPVRSLRPYYIDWASAFDASIAHVGGSPDALAQIRSGGKDLDQFFNADSYWRQPTRDAPHNVYTSFDRLDALNQSKGYTSSHFNSLPRKADSKLNVPTAKSINLAISSSLFNVHYDYDPTTNSYMRSEGGAAHTVITGPDGSGNQQLHPKVIVALIMGYGIDSDGQHSDYSVSGNGPVYIFQDGGVNQGTWEKTDRTSQFSFKDPSGNLIKLDAGQTWFTALGDSGMVSYAP